MKSRYNFYFLLCFISLTINKSIAQDLVLKLYCVKKEELKEIQQINFNTKHRDSISIYNETKKISNYLKNIGYFTNTLDSIKNKGLIYTSYFSLNKKTDSAYVKINKNIADLFDQKEITDSIIKIPIEKLQSELSEVSEKMERDGKTFSKIRLENLTVKNKILFANLIILESKKRNIDNIKVKGYPEFPKSFIKNYFNINTRTIFNKNKVEEISKKSKNLQFVKEVKSPEILFTKDSTILYLYLKKKQNNSFDGIVNFTSKDNGEGILFNGNIDLKLSNLLNSGENFELFWNSVGDERQEFKLKTEIPYLLNSKISPEFSFSIYKQDSTFLNTKFDSKLFYSLNIKAKLAVTFSSESSENLKESINSNIDTFNNYFLGIQFTYKKPKGDLFFNDKFHLSIKPSLGKRTTEYEINQFKIETSVSYIYDINTRNKIFAQNKTGYLNSESFVNNELFRIGGPTSIRGFNEQSIFTNNYSFFNIDYRYLTSQKSYFYTISDFGSAKIASNRDFLLSIGLGYLFKTANSLINISTSINKTNNTVFNTKNAQLTIQWVSYF